MNADAEAAEFRKKWESYVNGLDRLRSNLDDDQTEVLDDTQDQLRALVNAAAENRGSDR